MTDDSKAAPLHLKDVIHEATVTVDEQGTVASAATAAIFDTVGARIADAPPVTMKVDRPFLFVISDSKTHTPLFVGRVTDPTQK